MDNTSNNIFNRNPLTIYFILAFAITWLILSPGVAATLGLLDFKFDGGMLFTLGAFGPLLAAMIVTKASEGNTGVRKIFDSMFNWRVKPRWWAAAVLLFPGLCTVATALGMLIGGCTPDPGAGIAVIVLFLSLLTASFGEETGWRGFALPRLQQRLSPLKATLILALFWWLWHLPIFWVFPSSIGGVQQFGFGAMFGIQLINCIVLGILFAWIYNGSGGSILMPVLMNASLNFWLIGFLDQEAIMFLLPMVLVTAIVVGFTTKWKLGYTKEDTITA